jgi:hypothetical protein
VAIRIFCVTISFFGVAIAWKNRFTEGFLFNYRLFLTFWCGNYHQLPPGGPPLYTIYKLWIINGQTLSFSFFLNWQWPLSYIYTIDKL